MASLSEFSKRIRVIANSVETAGPRVAREAAAVILQTVVMATPVGNKALWTAQARRRARPGYVGGRARANWLVGIGEARAEAVQDTDATGAGTIAAGNATIATAKGPHAEIHITNNLPYIVPLNEGHSKQAPSGFVEIAVANALAAIANAKVLP